jgi:hypothetical protein
MSRLGNLGILAAIAAIGAAPGGAEVPARKPGPRPKPPRTRDAFGGRLRPNRRHRHSPEAYAMLAAHRLKLRCAAGSQAMHREMRKRAAESLGTSVEMYRDIARSNGAWIGWEA